MRKIALKACLLLVCLVPFLYPPDAAGGCPSVVEKNHQCKNAGCNLTIKVKVCPLFPQSAKECKELANWIQCCDQNHLIGSAAQGQDCDSNIDNPLGSIPETQGPERWKLARVYVPSCRGGYVPGFVRAQTAP